MDENRVLWEKCAAFHGHVCGGLTIGYKAALYAVELLELTFSEDEQVVCICENDEKLMRGKSPGSPSGTGRDHGRIGSTGCAG